MKKTLLALVVAATATTANAAEVFKSEDASVNFYGQLRQELKFIDGNDPTLSSGSSRMGVDASYSVSDEFKIAGLVEVSIKDTSDMYVRLHQWGFDTATAGSFRFGKAWTTSDDIGGTDFSYFFGGTANLYGTLSDASHSSQIKYTFENDAFWLKAGYGLSEDNSEQELAELFVGKSFGDLAVHVGGGFNEDEAKVLKNTYFEGTAAYTFGAALISFTYYNATLESDAATFDIDQNGYALAGTYQLNDKTTAYAGYEFVTHDAGSIDEDGTVIYLGTEYKFSSWARVYAEYGYRDGVTLGYTTDNVSVDPARVDDAHNFGIGARFYW